MNIVGYLITLANIQSFQNLGGSLKDVSVRVSECQVLLDELKRQPEFILETFRKTSYSQVNNIGKYMSSRLHDYIFKGKGDPKDEAVVLTLYFNDTQPALSSVPGNPENPQKAKLIAEENKGNQVKSNETEHLLSFKDIKDDAQKGKDKKEEKEEQKKEEEVKVDEEKKDEIKEESTGEKPDPENIKDVYNEEEDDESEEEVKEDEEDDRKED